MTVKGLLEKYEKAQRLKKEYDFSQHIKTKYVPYTEKLALVNGIINSTSYDEVNGINYYKRNTNALTFVFTIKLIEYYTDITIDTENLVQDYDTLMMNGLMDGLMKKIPPEEISILRGMIDMARDDLEINTRSLVSFLESKYDAWKLSMDALNKVIERPDVQEKLFNNAE